MCRGTKIRDLNFNLPLISLTNLPIRKGKGGIISTLPGAVNFHALSLCAPARESKCEANATNRNFQAADTAEISKLKNDQFSLGKVNYVKTDHIVRKSGGRFLTHPI